MSIHSEMEQSLLSAYERIFHENAPDWAVHKRNSDELVKPTIPFVGKKYAEQPKKILVYASAENLAGYRKNNETEWKGDWLDDDSLAQNRHRYCYNNPDFQNDPFFPHVHISPMNNGCLATAVYYIAEKSGRASCSNAYDFYEKIAFGNFSKYSIETELQRNIRLKNEAIGNGANVDFSKIRVKEAREKLDCSIMYLKADVEILNPDIIILPKSLYDISKKSYATIDNRATLIPIHQINAQVINCHIAPKHSPYDPSTFSPSVRNWYDALQQEGMTGKNKEKYLSVFTYLDDLLANM